MIEACFPNLAATGYAVTSPATGEYNCIAWAAGRTDDWWWPDPAKTSFWPAAVPREITLTAFVQAFEALGFVPCESDQIEAGFEKVALYALEGIPKHAARQLAGGQWTSKLGKSVDIRHSLAGLSGDLYGSVATILKRPASKP